MLPEFLRYISDTKLFTKRNSMLLAVSGGVDSMVLANLMHRAGFNFAIAHVNFKLRGNAANLDQACVEQCANKIGVPFFTLNTNTKAYAKNHKVSIQMAARDLRYAFFNELATEHRFDFVLTAHHQDDAMETLLINITRGTGIAGLHGILPSQGKIRRPLLWASRKQVEDYAIQHKIVFRNDASNLEEKYHRNKIRLKVMPVLKELNPSLDKAFFNLMKNALTAEQIQNEYLQQRGKVLCRKVEKDLVIQIDALMAEAHPELILYHLLQSKGFASNTAANVLRSFETKAAKSFTSPEFTLLKDRSQLVISGLDNTPVVAASISKTKKEITYAKLQIKLDRLKGGLLEHLGASVKAGSNTIYLDYEKIEFPITVRPWKSGDALVPFGMKGRKKISDILTDSKISAQEKKQAAVLVSGNRVVWLLGIRFDERFKITTSTKTVLRISVSNH